MRCLVNGLFSAHILFIHDTSTIIYGVDYTVVKLVPIFPVPLTLRTTSEGYFEFKLNCLKLAVRLILVLSVCTHPPIGKYDIDSG